MKFFLISFLIISFNLSAKSFSDINLLIDVNLANPMRELIRKYVEDNYISIATQLSHYKEILNLNTKDTDVIITSDINAISFLKDKELVENKILHIAGDRLILFTHPEFNFNDFSNDFSQSLQELVQYTDVIITDPKRDISGYLAKEMLLSLGINNIIQVKDQENAIHLIRKGKGIGLLFGNNKIDLKILSIVPQNLYEPISYQALVLKNQSSEKVVSFLKFLLLNKSTIEEHSIALSS